MFTLDRNPDWKSLYETAMRETDSAQVARRVAVARSAILDQIQKSISNPALAEHSAMDAALRNLGRLSRSVGSSPQALD